MASNVTGMGTTFNLPNYAGQLYTASTTKTPFLSMIGGLTGGMQTENDEFPTGVLYEFPEAAQPEISETASTTAPTGGELVKSQQTNVTQIFHEAIEITYARLANRGKLSGLNTAPPCRMQTASWCWTTARSTAWAPTRSCSRQTRSIKKFTTARPRADRKSVV